MLQQESTKIFFNFVDIILVTFMLVVFLNSCLIKSEALNLFNAAKWSALCMIYAFVKNIPRKELLLYGIVILGLFEVIIAFLQKLHWIDSNHHFFEVTGTWANPGQLGGFLAIALTIFTGLFFVYYKKYAMSWWGGIIIVFFVIGLVLSNSRAGWLAAISGICFLGGEKFRLNKFSFFSKLGIVLIFFCICFGGYLYKKESADGRLLIWRVSLNMIADAPIVGHGVGSFSEQYMYYQAQYFIEHPLSKYEKLADNIIYPYNELLHVWVELGIVGFILCLLILGVVLFFSPLYGSNKICVGAFITLTVFSMFSYPSNVFLLILLYPALLAAIDNEVIFKMRGSSFFKWLRWCGLLIGIYFIGRGCYYYYTIEAELKSLYSNSPTNVLLAKQYVDENYDKLQCIPQFLDIYAQYNYLHSLSSEAIFILEDTARSVPTSELLCDLGDLYFKIQNIEKAVYYYELANHMLPCRILPKYKLFSLYRHIGDTVNMKLIGEELLMTHVKVEGTQTLRMKGEVRDYLKDLIVF